ncbi:hypothetical protein BDY24DRAFT_432970 [Mrakia frigida]|uniref:uncharacterized protein n=1 Tax=Mrakia frigida TaxID=29902 RepID=UPI003FCBF19A
MSSIVYLVTGSNRPDGVGFNAVVALLAQSLLNHVIAAVRNPAGAEELQKIAQENERLTVVKMASDLESVKTAFNEVAGLPVVRENGIDGLLLNAGVTLSGEITASQIDTPTLLAELEGNTFGPMRVAQTFLPLLRLGKQKKIFYTSSVIGSTELAGEGAQPGGFTAYGLSKSAGNHFFKRLYNEIGKSESFTIVCYHPGYIATSMLKGGVKAGDRIGDVVFVTPEQGGKSAADNFIAGGHSGEFINEEGKNLPW